MIRMSQEKFSHSVPFLEGFSVITHAISLHRQLFQYLSFQKIFSSINEASSTGNDSQMKTKSYLR